MILNKEKLYNDFLKNDFEGKVIFLVKNLEKLAGSSEFIDDLLNNISNLKDTSKEYVLNGIYKILLDSIEKVNSITENEKINTFLKAKDFLSEVKKLEEEDSFDPKSLEDIIDNI